MENSFSLLFYIKRVKVDTNGKANIYFRITVNGRRAELSIKRKIDIKKWSTESGRAKGYSEEAQKTNQLIDLITNKIHKIHQDFIENSTPYSAVKIRDMYLGKDDNQKMLLVIFQDHNNQVNKLIGKDFAPGTAERYKTAKMHVENYIKKEYNINDIPVKNVDHKFITGFEYYLKTERNCSHNTAIKYITNFKKIIRIAYANDWIKKDPFFNWKARLKVVDREFLSAEDLQSMLEKNVHTTRLDQVKDIFIFCCFTGLAYADVKKLSENDIVTGIDGGQWIKLNRKTEHYSYALELARLIILNYSPDIASGKEKMISLLFDMNELWEEFIYIQLKKYLTQNNSEWVIEAQSTKSFIGFHYLKPDIVLTNTVTGEKIVIDTKWKLGDKYVSIQDLRQVYTYGRYWNAEKVMLLYPGSDENQNFRQFVNSNDQLTHKCKLGFINVFNKEGGYNEAIGEKVFESLDTF